MRAQKHHARPVSEYGAHERMKAQPAIGWVQPRVGSSEPQPRATEENEIRGKGVRYIGGRTIYRCQTGAPMTLPDFDKPRDPDASSKKLWAAVPEPIRKDVEQHVSANLPDNLLARLREIARPRTAYQS